MGELQSLNMLIFSRKAKVPPLEYNIFVCYMTRQSLGPPRRTSFVVVARDRKVERPSWRCYGRGRGCLRRAVTVRTFIQKPLMSGQGLDFFKAPAQIPSTQPLCILRPGRALHLPGWAKQIIIYFPGQIPGTSCHRCRDAQPIVCLFGTGATSGA